MDGGLLLLLLIGLLSLLPLFGSFYMTLRHPPAPEVLPREPVVKVWERLYEHAMILDEPELATDAAYWVTFTGGTAPALEWLRGRTPDEYLALGASLGDLDETLSGPSVRSVLRQRIEKRWNADEASRKAWDEHDRQITHEETLQAATREMVASYGIPPVVMSEPLKCECGSCDGQHGQVTSDEDHEPWDWPQRSTEITDERLTRILEILDQASPPLVMHANDPCTVQITAQVGDGGFPPSCTHAWNANRCMKCSVRRDSRTGKIVTPQQFEQAPCSRCEVIPQVVDKLTDIGPAQFMRDGCEKCS